MVGEDDALCLDWGFVGVGISPCVCNAKAKVLKIQLIKTEI